MAMQEHARKTKMLMQGDKNVQPEFLHIGLKVLSHSMINGVSMDVFCFLQGIFCMIPMEHAHSVIHVCKFKMCK